MILKRYRLRFFFVDVIEYTPLWIVDNALHEGVYPRNTDRNSQSQIKLHLSDIT